MMRKAQSLALLNQTALQLLNINEDCEIFKDLTGYVMRFYYMPGGEMEVFLGRTHEQSLQNMDEEMKMCRKDLGIPDQQEKE